jgi:orotidine-5'-phosphate decarboxylase
MNQPVIFCAIDTPDLTAAKNLAHAMQDAGCGIKLGLEFFCTHGPSGVAAIRDAYPDLPLFLDLKLHDIPNTVVGALKNVLSLRPRYITLHAAGGMAMMQAAQDCVAGQKDAPTLLAVTVLTALDDVGLQQVGQKTPAAQQVMTLAALTQKSGLGGVVCSGHEIGSLRAALGSDFTLMVPGIRPAGSDAQDQKRVMTPIDAMRAGATHLVIGRPITGAADPAHAAHDIIQSLKNG